MLAATGRILTPVESVPKCRMNCMYWVIRKMKPKRAKNVTVTAPLAAENAGTLKRETSIIGFSERRSIITNTTLSAAVIANPPRLRTDPHPYCGASMIV